MKKKLFIVLIVAIITSTMLKPSSTYAYGMGFIFGNVKSPVGGDPLYVEVGVNLSFAYDETYVLVNLYSIDGKKHIIKNLKLKNPNGTGYGKITYKFKPKTCGDYSFVFYNKDNKEISSYGTRIDGTNGFCKITKK